MPTPLDLVLDPVSLGIFALYAGLVLCEALAPARSLPAVRGWSSFSAMSRHPRWRRPRWLPPAATETDCQENLP